MARFPFCIYRAALAVVTVGVLLCLIFLHVGPPEGRVKLGNQATEDIRAPRSTVYTDTGLTEELRKRAQDETEPIYTPRDPEVARRLLAKIDALFAAARRAHPSQAEADGAAQVRMSAFEGIKFSSKVVSDVARLSDARIEKLASESRVLAARIMSRDITSDQDSIDAAKVAVLEEASRLPVARGEIPLVASVVVESIEPNRLLDEAATQAAKERATRRVIPARESIAAGELVVAKGEKITQRNVDKLTALGLMASRGRLAKAASQSGVALLLFALGLVFLSQHRPAIYRETRLMGLLAIVVVGCAIWCKAILTLLGVSLSPLQQGYLGVGAVVISSMLLAILLEYQIGIVVGVLLAVYTAFLIPEGERFVAPAVFVSLVGILAGIRISDRAGLVRAGVVLAGSLILGFVLVGIASGEPADVSIPAIVWGAAEGFIVVAAVWVGVAIFERPFKLTTHMGLLELANPNHPLLKQLQTEAPGTYIHSIHVANMAEAAAAAIGADAPLTRVGALYHDIGKVKRPQFFVENQLYADDKMPISGHDKLTPQLSTLIITSHVKDGRDMALRAKLPPAVVDIIAQHHGDSLVTYFYAQAAGEESEVPGRYLEQRFRYDGPKPRTKEAAIVMLADACEGAARTLSKPTSARIEQVVHKILADKESDRQLEEAELTFKELRQIRDSIAKTITSQLHPRIDYPELPKLPAKKASQTGGDGSDSESAQKAERPAQAVGPRKSRSQSS